MTERRTIDKLETDPSKAEEIAFIEEVAESVPDNSYLKMLFTKQFMNWLREQIRNDFYPNLYEFWQQDVSDIENLHLEISRLKFQVEDTNKVLAVKSKALSDLQEVFNTAQEAAGRNYDKLYYQLEDAEKIVENLKGEIINLKAKLYDMMVAKEN